LFLPILAYPCLKNNTQSQLNVEIKSMTGTRSDEKEETKRSTQQKKKKKKKRVCE
jgi:hypothetical protein